jgi:16S rRNA G966 N2-methylase RsmD
MMDLNENFSYQGADYSTTQSSIELPRHRWYLIKEGFSPKLVDAAMDSVPLRRNDLVLDPFAGCGTVPLTAAQRGTRAVGIEVNPFLSFVSETKVKSCNADHLRSGAQLVLAALENSKKPRSALEGYSTFSPRPNADRWLFNTQILRTFAAGWAAVAGAKPSTHRFLRLALVKAAMDNCNAKADGKCLRYKKEWETLNYQMEDFFISFGSHVAMIANDIGDVPIETEVSVINRDSRQALKKLRTKFRLCITSPPYLNSFDYSDVYRPELFLMSLVRNTEELRKIRLRTVRSHVQVRWQNPTESDFGPLYKETIRELKSVENSLWDKRIPTMVQAYFEDMKRVLQQLYMRAATGAQTWLVVSTSAYGGIEIPVDLILANIGTKNGWLLKEIGVIRQIRHSGHHWSKLSKDQRRDAKLRESVVVLERSPKSA